MPAPIARPIWYACAALSFMRFHNAVGYASPSNIAAMAEYGNASTIQSGIRSRPTTMPARIIAAKNKKNCMGPNENKMSDGHRERASLEVEAHYSLKS